MAKKSKQYVLHVKSGEILANLGPYTNIKDALVQAKELIRTMGSDGFSAFEEMLDFHIDIKERTPEDILAEQYEQEVVDE